MTARFMRSVLLAGITGTMLLGSFVLPAQALEGRISWSDLAKKLEDKGYNIREIERKRDGWKAKVTDSKGERYELRLNRNGTIVREEYDD